MPGHLLSAHRACLLLGRFLARLPFFSEAVRQGSGDGWPLFRAWRFPRGLLCSRPRRFTTCRFFVCAGIAFPDTFIRVKIHSAAAYGTLLLICRVLNGLG